MHLLAWVWPDCMWHARNTWTEAPEVNNWACYSTRQTQGIARLSFERVRLAYERVQTNAWTRSNKKSTAFEREGKRVWMRNQTRLDEKPNAFGWEVKRSRTRAKCVSRREQLHLTIRQMLSDEKLNAFTQLHVFERGPTRIQTRTFTRSNEDLHAFNCQLNAFVSHVERVCIIPCVWRVL